MAPRDSKLRSTALYVGDWPGRAADLEVPGAFDAACDTGPLERSPPVSRPATASLPGESHP